MIASNCRCHATFVALDDEDKGKSKSTNISQALKSDNACSQLSCVCHTRMAHFDADQVGDLQRKYKFCRRLFQSKDISQLASTAKENGGYAQMYNICHESMVESGLTLIKVRKQYLPRNENLYKVVFGGDILITLETAAVTCANQMYGGCKRFYCIGMRSVGFLHAVPVIQALEVHAKVVGCSQHVVCVLVYSYVDRKHDGSDMALCHHGVFHLASVSSKEMQAEKLIVGVKQPDVSEAEEEVRDFLRGMSLPLSTEVANAWNVEGDQFPMAPSGMT